MAKKRKTSSSEKKSDGYSVELTGLIMILIGLIGFGFGPVGALLKKFAMFLLGEWWPALLLFVLIMGFYMLLKRKLPNFFSARCIGLYLAIFVILTLSHLSFATKVSAPKEIFEATLQNYTARVSSIGPADSLMSSGQASITIGGGIFGAAFSFVSYSFFGLNGTYIVLLFVGLFALVLLFNFNLSEMLNKGVSKVPNPFKHEHGIGDDEDEEEDLDEVARKEKALEARLRAQDEEPSRVISSLDELKKPKVEESTSNVVVPSMSIPSNPNYQLPSLNLLDKPEEKKKTNSNQFLLTTKQNLERALEDFQIHGKVVDIHTGPAVTQFEVVVPSGTKVSRISSINKEIALALAAKDVRIQAPIPGKSTIGVEIPNQKVAPVKIREILGSNEMLSAKGGIQVALGKDLEGVPRIADISKMPHLLVAGSTGSGKSVCTNSIIISILMRYRPDEVKLVLVDPKQVELSNYNGVPHLLCPVVTNPKKASATLQKIVQEMDKRYQLFADEQVRKIEDYNQKIVKTSPDKKMPYIVVIIDEMADLMVAARKEVEESIQRITQLARAAGIHLITATQRPSTDVITGVIKSNIPSRIAFAVASQIDSRTILDAGGAEKLLGKGDMLFLPMGQNTPVRIQGCFVSDSEIEKVINATVSQQKASYDATFENIEVHSPSTGSTGGGSDEADDEMYNDVVEFAVQTGHISASLIQRKFRFGFNRAARMIDLLEERGIVGPQNGSKPREVLVKLQKEDDE